MPPVVNGHLRDPVSTKYWSFEDKLLPNLCGVPSGTPGVSGDEVDLRPFTSPRHDQTDTSTCVGQSVVKTLELKRIMKYGRDAHVDLSVLALYYLARELMFPQRTNSDSGTAISLACDAAWRFGVCKDTDWPWDKSKINTSPSWMAMRSAYQHKIMDFYRINSTGQDRVDAVILALRNRNPVVFGTIVGEDWFGYQGGTLSFETQPRGSHATVIEGWKNGLFIGENSWGNDWGEDGFYYMDPQVIASDDAYDFWVIRAAWE